MQYLVKLSVLLCKPTDMRFLLACLFSLVVAAVVAQPVSKKGEPFLPEAGEYALGVDAAPFLFYLGNMFSSNGNQAPNAAFTNPQLAITLKMFKRDDLAYRYGLRLGLVSNTWNGFQPEFSNVATDNNVKDSYNRTVSNVYVSYGIEKRKGQTRIQGFYGIEGGLGFGTESHSFTYGNAIEANNTVPNRTEFELVFQENPENDVTNFGDNNSFITEYRMGTRFSLGARAFVGAEIFVFPKVSIGVEFGLAAMVAVQGKGRIEAESWTIPTGGGSETLVSRATEVGGSTMFGIDTDNTRGSLNLNFYF